MTETEWKRLLLSRVAARIERFHTVPTHHRQTVGEHTFGVLNILLTVYPNASPSLLRAALYHDLPEAITGDMPAPTKWRHKELGHALDQAEQSIIREFELEPALTHLRINEQEKHFLKYADTMECAMFCIEEASAGDRKSIVHAWNCMDSLMLNGLISLNSHTHELYWRVQRELEQRFPRTTADERIYNGWPTYY